MKKKKIILGLIIIVLALTSIPYFKYLHKRGPRVLSRKSIIILDQVISPDKKHKATLFYDDGCATVAQNVRISITKNDDSHIYDSDIFFLLTRTPEFNNENHVNMKWTSSNSLNVQYDKWDCTDEIKQLKKVKDISINYEVKNIE